MENPWVDLTEPPEIVAVIDIPHVESLRRAGADLTVGPRAWTGNPLDCRVVVLDSALGRGQGDGYREERFALLAEAVGGESPLADHLLTLPYIGYRVDPEHPLLGVLPSQLYSFELARRLVAQDRLVMSGTAWDLWVDQVPELKAHRQRGRVLLSDESERYSLEGLGATGFAALVAALKAPSERAQAPPPQPYSYGSRDVQPGYESQGRSPRHEQWGRDPWTESD